MSELSKTLLDQFDSLPPSQRQQVLIQLLRREAFGEHDPLEDLDLVAAGDEVFLELDRHENEK